MFFARCFVNLMTHGLGRDFSVFGGLGWFGSKIAKVLKFEEEKYVNAFKARLVKIWLFACTKQLNFIYGRSDRSRRSGKPSAKLWVNTVQIPSKVPLPRSGPTLLNTRFSHTSGTGSIDSNCWQLSVMAYSRSTVS